MTRNLAFDRFRGIGALCVVLLHAPPLYHSGVEPIRIAGWVLRALCQSAVPFFFLLSGWMLASRWKAGRHSLRDFLQGLGRILLLYCPWFVAYLALDLSQGHPGDWGDVARRFVGFSDSRAVTDGYHLWFLPTLVLAQAAVWATLRWTGSVRPILLVGCALYLAMSVLDGVGIALPFGLAPHEGLNISLVCVSAGAWLVFAGISDRPSNWGIATVVAMVLLVAESFLWDRSNEANWSIHPFPAFRVLLPAFLLLYLNRSPTYLGGGIVGRALDLAGRNATTIYVGHIAVLVLVPFAALVPNGFLRDNLVRWSVAFVLPMLVGEIMRRSPNRIVRSLFQ